MSKGSANLISFALFIAVASWLYWRPFQPTPLSHNPNVAPKTVESSQTPARVVDHAELCRRGEANSCLQAGHVALSAKNSKTAEDYFKAACEGNNAQGCEQLAAIAKEKGDYEGVISFASSACRLGLRSACSMQNEYAERLFYLDKETITRLDAGSAGFCTEHDAKACLIRGWPQRTGNSLLGNAQFDFACRYGDPRGCLMQGLSIADRPKRNEKMKQACAAGIAVGCFEEAESLPDSSENRASLYDQACSGGVSLACAQLGLIIQRPGAEEAWLTTYQSECERGLAKPCFELGRKHLNDSRVVPAGKFFALACDYGHKESCEKRNKTQVVVPELPKPSRAKSIHAIWREWSITLTLFVAPLLLCIGLVVFFSAAKRSLIRKKGLSGPSLGDVIRLFVRETYGSRSPKLIFVSYLLAMSALVNVLLVFRWADPRTLWVHSYFSRQDLYWPYTVEFMKNLFGVGMLFQLVVAAGLFERKRWALTMYGWGTPILLLSCHFYPTPEARPSPLFWLTIFYYSPLLLDVLLYRMILHGGESWFSLPAAETPKFASTVGQTPSLTYQESAYDVSRTAGQSPVGETVRDNVRPMPPPLRAPKETQTPLRSCSPEDFTNLELIGEGVSARVFKARDSKTNTTVALKVLNPHLRTDRISLERFRREIKITRLLNHPQIVSIYDLATTDEKVYLVMEYIDGLNLKDYIKVHSPLPLARVVSFLNQILGVLTVCHERNVIHRDLKPQNVIVMNDATLKLLDFGVARMTSLSDLTQTGTSLGSPEYMAPELFSSNSYDPRTDIYALGVMAFEMLTGSLPFQGDSLAQLFHQHVEGPVPNLTLLRPEVPEWLRHMVERMLSKQAFERYQCVEEIMLDLSAKRVLLKDVRSSEKRICAPCGGQTLHALPICTLCGHDFGALFERGTFNVKVSATADPEKISTFLKDVFRTGTNRGGIGGGSTLLRSVDEHAAQALKHAAARQGLYLQIEQEVQSKWGKLPSTITLLLTHGSVLVLGGYSAVQLLIGSRPGTPFPELEYPLFFLTIAIISAWYASRSYLSSAFAPVLETANPMDAKGYPALRELAPLLAAEKSPAMRNFVSQMIERHHLITSHLTGLDTSTRSQLDTLMRLSVEASIALSDMETALNDPKIFQWGQTFTQIETQMAASSSPTERAALVSRQRELQEKLEAYFEIEARHAGLVGNLSKLSYFFTSILGRTLVLKEAFSVNDIEQVEESVKRLKETLIVSREVKQDLEKAA